MEQEKSEVVPLKLIDSFTVSILSIKLWQVINLLDSTLTGISSNFLFKDIWSRVFGEAPLRFILEHLIHTELASLNKAFKKHLEQHGFHTKWVCQEELWKHLVSKETPCHSRLFPLINGGAR